MQTAQQAFERQHANMTETLERLEADLNSGLAKWEDDARDAYFDAKAKWNKAAEQQAKSIKEFAEVVRAARENYSSAEQASLKIWQG
jgi:WXG100 family type VII secretion target